MSFKYQIEEATNKKKNTYNWNTPTKVASISKTIECSEFL